MGERFLEPTIFRGLPTENAREWIEQVESWFLYQQYTGLPEITEPVDGTPAQSEAEKKAIRTAVALAKRKVPHILSLLIQGPAGDWFKGLAKSDTETFEAFKVKFTVRFLADRRSEERRVGKECS